jgi:hypothetical protein
MSSFDEAHLALEAATGGKNTLILDDLGYPSVMVRIPSFRWSEVLDGGEDAVCSAFVVDGVERDSIYISKYLNIIEYERAYSLPARDPAHTLTIDEARAACARKGRGWHLMSNAEWTAIAHWCRKNGTYPNGNNNFGREITRTHEHGVKSPENALSATPSDRTLTGLSPDTWSHDGTSSGIFDLNGNIWDFVSGVRLYDGELQVIPDNDSALNVDESADSPLWRAIDIHGNLVPPGSPNTYKYDGTAPGSDSTASANIPGGMRLNTRVEFPQYTGEDKSGNHGYSFMPFQMLPSAVGSPHIKLTQLGLYPASRSLENEMFFARNYGECTAARGGSWYDGAAGGLWDLYMRERRAFVFPDIGFRSCYIDV